MGFGKDKKGVIIRDYLADGLGALNASDAKKIGTVAVTEDFRVLKTEVQAMIHGLTANEAEQIILGLCDHELEDSEIAECLTTSGPLDRNDRQNEEQATRPVFPMASAVFDDGEVDQSRAHFRGKGNGPVVSKKRWSFSNSEGFGLFLMNAGSQNLTTGATIRGIVTYYGVWLS